MVDQRVGLVGLQRGGDGQPGGCVSVEDVDQLLLLDGSWTEEAELTLVLLQRSERLRGRGLTDHHSSAFGVDGQELSRDDAPAAALPKRLLVDLLKHVLGRAVLQDDDATAVAPDDDVVCKHTSVSEAAAGAASAAPAYLWFLL